MINSEDLGPAGAANPVLAEVVRSGFTESRHRGVVVALAADGMEDGASRARTPVTSATLRRLGAAVPDAFSTVPVTGGVEVVGVIRAVGLALSPGCLWPADAESARLGEHARS
jgi:hypothetical protein